MSIRLVLVSFLGQPPACRFRTIEWPLHMTLLPPFTFDGSLRDLAAGLDMIAKRFAPFDARTDGTALFGRNADVPVSLVQADTRLDQLHDALASFIGSLGNKTQPPAQPGPYRYHVTVQRGIRIPDRSDIPISAFSLVDRQAGGQPGWKEVIGTFKLGVGDPA